MKAHAGFLTVLLLCALPAAGICAEDMVRYTNEEIGFSVYHPASWFAFEEDGGILIATDPEFTDASQDTGAAFGVMTMPMEMLPSSDIEEIWSSLTEDMDELVSPEALPITIGGVDGFYGIVSDPDEDMSGAVHLIVLGDKLFMVVTAIHPASELAARHEPTLKAILETLEFDNPR